VTEKNPPPHCISPSFPREPASDTTSSDCSGGLTLEHIIDEIDEMSHLNRFIEQYVEKMGGFTTPEAYFAMIQPVLDLLEAEIRVRYAPGMTKQDMKLVVQDWIDYEIAMLHKE
jgi:hypothetical protein